MGNVQYFNKLRSKDEVKFNMGLFGLNCDCETKCNNMC